MVEFNRGKVVSIGVDVCGETAGLYGGNVATDSVD